MREEDRVGRYETGAAEPQSGACLPFDGDSGYARRLSQDETGRGERVGWGEEMITLQTRRFSWSVCSEVDAASVRVSAVDLEFYLVV